MVSTDHENDGSQAPDEKRVVDNSWNWKEHIPLLITGISILFISIRLLSVANYDFETADGILQSSGTASVVIGALIPTIGYITLPAALSLGAMLTIGEIDKSSRPFAWVLAAFLFVASVFVAPASAFAITVFWGLLLLIVVLVARRQSRSQEKNPRTRLSSRKSRTRKLPIYTIAAWTIFIVINTAVNSVPWLPAEVIVSGRMRPFTGFVLGETVSDVTILTSQTRQIVHVAPSAIISRTVCRQRGVAYGGFFVETIPTLIGGPDNSGYPTCPQ